MIKFKKNKYAVIRKAIDKDFALFLYNYFLMKKQVYDTMLQLRYISPFESAFGFYEPPENEGGQIPDTYSCYSDIAFETLMLKCQPIMEKTTGLKLYPAYSYSRIYKKDDELKKHIDRFSCEISTTMHLGGDKWPIYLKTSEKLSKKIKIDLNPGDMLVYRGIELEHWREKFEGNHSAQVFLHYNNTKTKFAKDNMFDGRKHLGLPGWFKK